MIPIPQGMTPKDWLEAALIGVMVFALFGTFFLRWSQDRGITTRMIQLVGVSFVFPTLVILAMEQVLTKETAATLLGTIIGYLLSGLSRAEPPRTPPPQSTPPPDDKLTDSSKAPDKLEESKQEQDEPDSN